MHLQVSIWAESIIAFVRNKIKIFFFIIYLSDESNNLTTRWVYIRVNHYILKKYFIKKSLNALSEGNTK